MYLDNAATTPLTDSVKEYVISILDKFGNPSSLYRLGDETKQIITCARRNVAQFINADPKNIIFTSSGSASNTLAIRGYMEANETALLYSPIAHKSILEYEKYEPKAYKLKVDNSGNIDLDDLKDWVRDRQEKYLVAIDYANSEIGTIQDVKKIIEIVHFYGGTVYLDCTGSIPQIPLDVKSLDVDMAGFSAHKLGALKGCGVLYKKPHINLSPLVYGSQEFGYVGGTENILGIASLGKAVEEYDYSSITSENRDYLYKNIRENIAGVELIGALKNRLPLNLYLCVKNVEGEALTILLDTNGYQVSTGSACSSGSLAPSPTLQAIQMNGEDLHSCIRITLSGKETKEELDDFCKKLRSEISILRSYGM